MHRLHITTAALASLLLVAACGDTRGERALSGGAIGAGAGAGAAAITDNNPLAGALVGGAVGAGVGALTYDDDDRYDRRRGYSNDRYGRYNRNYNRY